MTMPTRGYLICCIERTGSTLLGQALTGTNVAGRPQEYFNPVEQERPWDAQHPGRFHDGGWPAKDTGEGDDAEWSVRREDSRRALPQPGFKNQRGTGATRRERPQPMQIPDLGSETAVYELLRSRHGSLRSHAAALEALRAALPDLRMIWLRRNNMVARAVSHFRARETGVWHKGVVANPNAPPAKAHEYDLAKIRYLYCLGVFEDALWERFFDEQKIVPYQMVYEELIAEYEPTVRGVLRFLDVEPASLSIPAPRSAKQSDSVSEDWEARYREVCENAEPLAPRPLSPA